MGFFCLMKWAYRSNSDIFVFYSQILALSLFSKNYLRKILCKWNFN